LVIFGSPRARELLEAKLMLLHDYAEVQRCFVWEDVSSPEDFHASQPVQEVLLQGMRFKSVTAVQRLHHEHSISLVLEHQDGWKLVLSGETGLNIRNFDRCWVLVRSSQQAPHANTLLTQM
jgi:hypothetical protein